MANLAPYMARDQTRVQTMNMFSPQNNPTRDYTRDHARDPARDRAMTKSTTRTHSPYSSFSGLSSFDGGIDRAWTGSERVDSLSKRTALQDIDGITLESRQDISTRITPRIDWDIPVPMTPRQKENKKLIDNHNNINKRLNPDAQKRQERAQRTRILLNYFRSVKRTESNRRQKGVQSVRYLDTVDGVSWEKELKEDLEARKQAIWLLHDNRYQFSGNAGVSVYDKRDIHGRHRTMSTMLAPFV